MINEINEIGNKYGKWTVISPAPSKKCGAIWNCECECGNKKVVRGSYLRDGSSYACHSCSIKNSYKYLNIINNEDILNGLLLGDGCIYFRKTCCTPTLRVGQTDKDLVEYLKNKLCPDAKIYKRITKTKPVYYFAVNHPLLIPIYERWYKNNRKIVPQDLSLAPLTVLNWFMGDGCTSWSKSKKQAILTLSTESFTKEEVVFLQNKLNHVLNEKINISTNKGSFSNKRYFRLSSGKSSFTNAFFDYIGKCPVNGMEYKWKRGRKLTTTTTPHISSSSTS